MSDAFELKMLPGIRWAILRTVHVAGHHGATEPMIRTVIDADFMGCSAETLRKQLHYLKQRKLVDVEESEIDSWVVRLTRCGYDLVEYRVDCEAGIARPALRH